MKIKDLLRLVQGTGYEDIRKKLFYGPEEVIKSMKKGHAYFYITNWKYKDNVQFVMIKSYDPKKNRMRMKNLEPNENLITKMENVTEGNTFQISDLSNRFVRDAAIVKLNANVT
jgi:hypothetical protein